MLIRLVQLLLPAYDGAPEKRAKLIWALGRVYADGVFFVDPPLAPPERFNTSVEFDWTF